MQSVVTGQAPITLERKITSGEKQIKTDDITHNNWNRSYCITQTKKKNGEIIVRMYQDTYHTLNESQQKATPRTQHGTHKKKTGWIKRCPNRNRKTVYQALQCSISMHILRGRRCCVWRRGMGQRSIFIVFEFNSTRHPSVRARVHYSYELSVWYFLIHGVLVYWWSHVVTCCILSCLLYTSPSPRD